MTFEEQIAGVPMELVRQGWRREPAPDVLDQWSGAYRFAYRWQIATVDAADELIIYRPIMPMNGCKTVSGLVCCVYAHAGWGDGLAPTPEMVKVWPSWWYRPLADSTSVPPGIVNVDLDLDGVPNMEGQGFYRRPVSSALGSWFGPVLPPVQS